VHQTEKLGFRITLIYLKIVKANIFKNSIIVVLLTCMDILTLKVNAHLCSICYRGIAVRMSTTNVKKLHL